MEAYDFDIATLNVLAGAIIPVLVGLVAKSAAGSGVKSVLNAVLSAATAAVAVVVQADAYVVQDFLAAGFTTFVVSISTYYGFWKPTGVTAKVAEKTSDFGIGG